MHPNLLTALGWNAALDEKVEKAFIRKIQYHRRRQGNLTHKYECKIEQSIARFVRWTHLTEACTSRAWFIALEYLWNRCAPKDSPPLDGNDLTLFLTGEARDLQKALDLVRAQDIPDPREVSAEVLGTPVEGFQDDLLLYLRALTKIPPEQDLRKLLGEIALTGVRECVWDKSLLPRRATRVLKLLGCRRTSVGGERGWRAPRSPWVLQWLTDEAHRDAKNPKPLKKQVSMTDLLVAVPDLKEGTYRLEWLSKSPHLPPWLLRLALAGQDPSFTSADAHALEFLGLSFPGLAVDEINKHLPAHLPIVKIGTLADIASCQGDTLDISAWQDGPARPLYSNEIQPFVEWLSTRPPMSFWNGKDRWIKTGSAAEAPSPTPTMTAEGQVIAFPG